MSVEFEFDNDYYYSYASQIRIFLDTFLAILHKIGFNMRGEQVQFLGSRATSPSRDLPQGEPAAAVASVKLLKKVIQAIVQIGTMITGVLMGL